jgi:protein TonB
MKSRKTSQADLEHKRSLFFELGMVIVLAIVLFSMELNFKEKNEGISSQDVVFMTEEEMVPITRQEQTLPPPAPKVVQVFDVINIVDNDIEIEEDLEILDSETNQDAEVEMIELEAVELEEEISEAEIFIVVEEMPIFMPETCKSSEEGNRELMLYIGRSLRYPVVAAENGIEGKVFVNFVVSPMGNVTNVSVSRGVHPELDREAIRVVSNLPAFSPGRQRGKAVNVQYAVPINFILQ